MPVKPVKTERTHEQNQERAYIAASRRSDRRLEARIKSARRASEIHKRRTGRSLRVTEADVVNEEVYEEEDDDLTMQYRRLPAHLQTQNADFDRRLAAYLMNHATMRSALGQSVLDAWQTNQSSNISHFVDPNMMQMSTPLQTLQQHQHAFSNQTVPPQQEHQQPQTGQLPVNYRQSPCQVNNGQPVRPTCHARSISITIPNQQGMHLKLPGSAHNSLDSLELHKRRVSMPVQQGAPATPASYIAASVLSNNASSVLSQSGSQTDPATAHVFQQQSPQQSSRSSAQSCFPSQYTTGSGGFGNGNFDLLSTTLPLVSQQLLDGAPADLNIPSMFIPPQQDMSYGKQNQQPFYWYNPNGMSKSNGGILFPSYNVMPQGMNQVLSMTTLDTNGAYTNSPNNDSVHTPYTPAGYGSGFDTFSAPHPLKELSSGEITPCEGDWQALMNTTETSRP